MTAKREAEYYTEVRRQVRIAWKAFHELKALQSEWKFNGYDGALPDGAGDNARLVRADLRAALFDTTDAVFALLDEGKHGANLAKLL